MKTAQPQAAYYLVIGGKDIILHETDELNDAADYAALWGGRVCVVLTNGQYRFI